MVASVRLTCYDSRMNEKIRERSSLRTIPILLLWSAAVCPAIAVAQDATAPPTAAEVDGQINGLRVALEMRMTLGDVAGAAELVEQIAELQQEGATDPVEAADSWMHAAELHFVADQLSRAVAAVERCIQSLQQAPNAAAWQMVDAQLLLKKLKEVSQLSDADRGKLRDALARQDEIEELFASGDLDEALQGANSVLATVGAVLGEDDVEVAKLRRDASWLLQELGDSVAAVESLQRAIGPIRDAYGEQHPEYAATLADLATAQRDAGDLHASRDNAAAAVKVFRDTVGNDSIETLGAVTSLASTYFELADYEHARLLYEEVAATAERLYGPTDPRTAMASSNLGLLLRDMGEFGKAKAALVRTLTILRQTYGEQHPETARALDNLGELLTAKGEFAEAKTYLEKSLQIRRQTLGEWHPDVAASLYNLGSHAQALGDLPTALACFQRSRDIASQAYGPQHPMALNASEQLGVLLMDEGKYAAALPLLTAIYESRLAALGDDNVDVAESLMRVAEVRANLGDEAAARADLEVVLKTMRAAFGEDHLSVAEVHNMIGHLLMRDENWSEARTRFEEELRIRRKVLGERNGQVAFPLGALAIVLQEQGEVAAAKDLLEQAVAIARENFGAENPASAQLLSSLAGVNHDLGEFELAKTQLNQALEQVRAVVGEVHPETSVLLSNLGIVEALEGDFLAAADRIAQSRAIDQQLLETQLHRLSEQRMRQFVAVSAGNLDLLASLPIADLGLADQAAEALLFEKALAFEVLNRRRAVERLALDDPEVAELRQKLLAAQRSLESLSVAAPAKGETAELTAKRQQLQRQCEQCENQLATRVAARIGDRQTLDVSLAEVREHLSTGAVLVEFLRHRAIDVTSPTLSWLPDRYAAAVIPADPGQPVAWIDLGPAVAIDKLIEELSTATREYARYVSISDEIDLEDEYRKTAARLHALVFAPLAGALGDSRQIFLGADGRLHELPFEALVSDTGDFLLEQGYQFAYLNSGRDLLQPVAESPGRGVYVFAGPNYNLAHEARVALAETVSLDGTAVQEAAGAEGQTDATALALLDAPAIVRGGETRAGWRPLPGADLEGREAAEAFTGRDYQPVRTFTGDEALERLVKQVRRPRVLVLVTHGDFLKDEAPTARGPSLSRGSVDLDSRSATGARTGLLAAGDPMLRSYLVFAGANEIDDAPAGSPLENGWLTAREIAGLDLRGTELVVLSACNTNRGESRNGQAVVGMRSAFLFAGARTIVGSLFEVPNVETRQLMKPFYDAVAAGEGKLAALSAAKLQFVRERRETHGAAHPFYWASFTLIGDPGAPASSVD